jgi:dihydroorotase
VIGQARTRLYAFVHISSIGLTGGIAPGEMLNIDYANVEACAKTLAKNPDTVLGVKVRITDNVVGNPADGLDLLRPATFSRMRTAALATISCRTASSFPPRARPSSAASSSMLATAVGPSTSRWRGRHDAGRSRRHDLQRHSRGIDQNTPGYPTLPWVMSKFMALGLSLEEVVQRDGPAAEFVDTRNNRKTGTEKLVPVLTVTGGRPFGRPYPFPFVY